MLMNISGHPKIAGDQGFVYYFDDYTAFVLQEG